MENDAIELLKNWLEEECELRKFIDEWCIRQLGNSDSSLEKADMMFMAARDIFYKKELPSGCEHDWKYFKTTMFNHESGYRQRQYIIIDYFHCSKCLEQKEVKKSENVGQSGETPSWHHKALD